LEILKILNEPPEIAYHYLALQSTVMILFSMAIPDEANRNDLFYRTVAKMIEREMIVAEEDNVIRLFKNAKANRVMSTKRLKKKHALGGWWPGQQVVNSDEENEKEVLMMNSFDFNDLSYFCTLLTQSIQSVNAVNAAFASNHICELLGHIFEVRKLPVSCKLTVDALNEENPPVESLSVPKDVYRCDLHRKDCVVDRLYLHNAEDTRELLFFFVDSASKALNILVITPRNPHTVQGTHLMDIFNGVQYSVGMVVLNTASLVFFVPTDSTLNTQQRVVRPEKAFCNRYPKLCTKALNVMAENQRVATLPPLLLASPHTNKRPQTQQTDHIVIPRVGHNFLRGSGVH
jgi:hypothetical protein